MPALPFLAPEVAMLFVGLLLLVFTLAQSAITKPHGESGGLLFALTAPLKVFVSAWNSLVHATVSRFAASHLLPVTRWFLSVNLLVRGYAKAQADMAVETANAVERVTGVVVPRETRRAVRPALRQARSASQTAHGALTVARADHSALTHFRTRTNTTLRHHTRQLTYTIPREIERVRAREEGLSRDVESLRNRARGLENGALKTFRWIIQHRNSLTVGVFAGAVSVALDRLGYHFLKCRSWRRLGGRLTCGMASWLEDVVFGVFTAIAVSDLCTFADGMDTLARQLQPLFLGLVDAEDALIGCHGATKPDPLTLPRLYLPPVPDPLPLG